MSPTAAHNTNEEAMIAETHAHYKRMMLLCDPEFLEGNRIGLGGWVTGPPQ